MADYLAQIYPKGYDGLPGEIITVKLQDLDSTPAVGDRVTLAPSATGFLIQAGTGGSAIEMLPVRVNSNVFPGSTTYNVIETSYPGGPPAPGAVAFVATEMNASPYLEFNAFVFAFKWAGSWYFFFPIGPCA